MTNLLPPHPLLIVSGDDFGLTPGVSDGILRAHEHGVLTSTSVLTNAPAFEGHANALSSSGVDAGLHICFVGEDRPLLTAPEIPTLVAPDGGLFRDWKQFLRRWLQGRIDPDDLTREADAQFGALRAAGVVPSHLDTHQHVHLWPSLANVILDLAARWRVAAVRVPMSHSLAPTHIGVNALSRQLRSKVAERNLLTTDWFVGLHQAGSWDEPLLINEVDKLTRRGAASVEIGTHPGLLDDPDRVRYRWGYQWSCEFDALTSARFTDKVARSGFTLGSFSDLAEVTRSDAFGNGGAS